MEGLWGAGLGLCLKRALHCSFSLFLMPWWLLWWGWPLSSWAGAPVPKGCSHCVNPRGADTLLWVALPLPSCSISLV